MSDWDDGIKEFLDVMGNAQNSNSIPKDLVNKFKSELPETLMKFWQSEGLGSYGDGLFWTVNPDDYKELLKAFTHETPYNSIESSHVIARNAFGVLHVWNSELGHHFDIDPFNHWIIPGTGEEGFTKEDLELEIDIFFHSASDDESEDETDEKDIPLFKRAIKSLGPLAENEMYGFVPALSLGGEKKLENLQKVDIFTHLAMLSELQETEVFDYDNYR